MKKRMWLYMPIVMATLIALACSTLDPIPKGAVNTGSLDFSNYVAVGNSLTAGYQSGGLVEGNQKVSYPAMIAGAAGAKHVFPNVSEPGIPQGLLYVSDYDGPDIGPKSLSPGAPTNLLYPGIYNNLGIPGARLNDLLTVHPNPVDANKTMYNIVLRDTAVTAVSMAALANPSVLTVWIGSNDILGPASMGLGIGMTDPATFQADYTALMTTLDAAAGAVIAANIPDVLTVPYFRTIPPFAVDSNRNPVIIGGSLVMLLGPGDLPLELTDLVLLPAAAQLAVGIGVPLALGGTDTGLGGEYILDATEQAAITTRTGELNTAISTVCSARGIPVADMNALFKDIAANGRVIRGNEHSTAFLTGGLFSVDGVHPSVLGYWLLACEFIDVMNANFGASIPYPTIPLGMIRDPYPAASASPSNLAAAISSLDKDDFAGLWLALGVPGIGSDR